MAEIPHASLKELLSTGYFYDELKKYSESPEMDISTYCSDFAVPYLIRLSESHDKSAQLDDNRIFKLAIRHLFHIKEEEIIDSIFGLKKVAVLELQRIEKASRTDNLDRSEAHANRRRQEAAESLIKLLVNIIKVFRLPEITPQQRKAESIGDPVGDAIMQNWEDQNCQAPDDCTAVGRTD